MWMSVFQALQMGTLPSCRTENTIHPAIQSSIPCHSPPPPYIKKRTSFVLNVIVLIQINSIDLKLRLALGLQPENILPGLLIEPKKQFPLFPGINSCVKRIRLRNGIMQFNLSCSLLLTAHNLRVQYNSNYKKVFTLSFYGQHNEQHTGDSLNLWLEKHPISVAIFIFLINRIAPHSWL